MNRGPVSFMVISDDGRIVRRHIDHIISRELSTHSESAGGEEEVSANIWPPMTPMDPPVDPQTRKTTLQPMVGCDVLLVQSHLQIDTCERYL